MKIAIFTDTFFPEINGVANTLSYLNHYLQERNISVHFIAPDYENEKQQQIPANVTRIKGFRVPIAPNSKVALPSYLIMKDTLKKIKPDIIHVTTQLGIGRIGLKYAKEHHIPIAMSYHTNFDQYLKFFHLQFLSSFFWNYSRSFYNQGQLTLCPSEDTLKIIEAKNFRNLGIWSRGVDLHKFNPSYLDHSLRQQFGGDDKLLFLYVGRISAEKDIDIYLESIKLVNQKIGQDKVNFLFTGLGPHYDIIKDQNISNIILTGPKNGEELSKIYASVDAFVFPSGTETFGNVLLEAMASGLPTISVNAGGVQEFAIHGYNSLVCDYHDAKSIADGIEELINNKELRNKLAQGALETAKQRSWNVIFDQLYLDYQKVYLEYHQNTKQVAVENTYSLQ